MLNIKTAFFTVLATCCMYLAKAQQIKLPDIYAGEDLSAALNANIKGNVQALAIEPIIPKAYTLPALTPKFLHQFCITHGAFAFVSLEAKRLDDGNVRLAFETENEYTSRRLIVERVFATGTENADITQPADSAYQLFAQANRVATFIATDSQYAKNRGYHKTSYEVTDRNSYTGISFYRITETDNEDTAVAFTKIIAVIGTPVKETISITPNPVVNQANVQVYSKYAGAATLQLISQQGFVVKQLQVYVNAGVNSLPLPAAGLAHGIYYVRLLRLVHTALQTNMVKL